MKNKSRNIKISRMNSHNSTARPVMPRGLTIMKKGGKADSGDKFAKGFFGNRATENVAGRAKHIKITH